MKRLKLKITAISNEYLLTDTFEENQEELKELTSMITSTINNLLFDIDVTEIEVLEAKNI